MPRRERKAKERKKGYRRYLSVPRKGSRPYKGSVQSLIQNVSSENLSILTTENGNCSDSTTQEQDRHRYCGVDVPPYRKGINVLSLFDGIGTARLSLEKIGVLVDKYISSEVDPKALAVLKHHYHDKIINIGCVRSISERTLDSYAPIHLLLGGSPCEDLSLCNPKRRGLHGSNSTGSLFFDYHRILLHLSNAAKRNGHKFYWLYENTFSMEKSTKDEISRWLGCEPRMKCASAHVAMVRRRYFWGNTMISHEPSIIAKPKPHLQDFLPSYRTANVQCVPTITTTSHSQRKGKQKVLPVIEDGTETDLFITEIESLFGLPRHYTDTNNLSITDRRKLIGRAWCVPVIAEILLAIGDDVQML